MKKNKKIFLIIFLIIIFILLFLILFQKNDGMNNYKISKTSYRAFYSNKWHSWNKNGLTVGDKKNALKKLEIKNKDNIISDILVYSNNEWIDITKLESSFTALKIINNVDKTKDYRTCYRVYNKSGWSNWGCNGYISGTQNLKVTALQVKSIPTGVVKYDYLKDYVVPKSDLEF